jgi:hypothetical protein
MFQNGSISTLIAALAVPVLCLQFGATYVSAADADPGFSFYGYGVIAPVPNPAIVDENTHITVTVSNTGADTATNVSVKLSFNDWGVTFQGWQEIQDS